jgi:hypothetical protein
VPIHPPLVPARTDPNLQDGPEESGIGRAPVLALPRVAEGGRVRRVEPSTTVGGLLVAMLGTAHAVCLPMSSIDVRPLDLDQGSAFKILQSLACVNGRVGPFFLKPNMLAPSSNRSGRERHQSSLLPGLTPRPGGTSTPIPLRGLQKRGWGKIGLRRDRCARQGSWPHVVAKRCMGVTTDSSAWVRDLTCPRTPDVSVDLTAESAEAVVIPHRRAPPRARSPDARAGSGSSGSGDAPAAPARERSWLYARQPGPRR